MDKFSGKRFAALVIFIILFSTADVFCQFYYFGRNKVQYHEFNWKVLHTKHFDIYYYGDMLRMAEIGSFYAEEVYDELKVELNQVVTRRVPLIFYNTTIDFQQTNTTPGLIPDGVGGFFEFLKGRVVLPSTGSLHDFRHVIRHELVHVFMTNKIYWVLKNHRIPTDKMPPLWFVEGIAEFLSTEPDAQAEMVMRDAVINNYFFNLDNIWKIYGSFLMYKEGQNFLEFVEEKYGKDKVINFLENFWMYSKFNEVMEYTLQKKIEQIDAEWEYYLKKKYYPLLADKYPTEFGAKKITFEGFNFSPVYCKTGDEEFIYFVANRDGYSSLYRMEYSKEENSAESPELVLRGEQTEEYESFHLFQSAIDISKNGLIAFITKKGASDAIHLLSVNDNQVVKTIQSEDLVFISSPKFSSNGNRIVFNAVDKKGFSDLFIYDLLNEKLYRITNDYYDDKDPVFGINDQQIIFTSDRTAGKFEKKYNLFSYDLNNNTIKYVTYLNTNSFSPIISPDKKELIFTSELDGIRNLYKIDIKQDQFGKTVKRISDFITSAYYPSFIDSSLITFSGFENFSFNIYVLDKNKTKSDSSFSVTFSTDSVVGKWMAGIISSPSELQELSYEKEYSLDFAQSVVATDPLYGTRGGAILSLSDLLGDDRYLFLLYNTASVQSDILKSFNILIQRVNFAERVNYGYGIFHFSGRRYDLRDPDEFYYEKSFGGSFLLSYPISKFQRIEATATIANSNKEVIPDVIERKALLFTNTLSYVIDNSLWGPTGPVDGMRGLVILGYTTDIKYSNVNYFSFIADYRYYQRFFLTTALAFRAAVFYNQGKESRRYIVGGSWDLRGWPRFGLRGEKVWLSSLELRFPLIDQINLRLPVFNLGLPGFRGALFYDMGGIWDEKYNETIGSVGFGFRMNLFNVLTLRYDIGKKIINDFSDFQKGLFYQFFFGWDF